MSPAPPPERASAAQPSEHTSAAPSAEAAPGARIYRYLGAAVDIGTTTIAAVLYREGRAVGTMGAWNPQSVFGADVISRIEASLEGKADKLAAVVREAVSCLLTELAEHAGERCRGH